MLENEKLWSLWFVCFFKLDWVLSSIKNMLCPPAIPEGEKKISRTWSSKEGSDNMTLNLPDFDSALKGVRRTQRLRSFLCPLNHLLQTRWHISEDWLDKRFMISEQARPGQSWKRICLSIWLTSGGGLDCFRCWRGFYSQIPRGVLQTW